MVSALCSVDPVYSKSSGTASWVRVPTIIKILVSYLKLTLIIHRRLEFFWFLTTIIMDASLSSDVVRERIQEALDEKTGKLFPKTKATGLKAALMAYSSAEGGRFGASARMLVQLARKICGFHGSADKKASSLRAVTQGQPGKKELAARLIKEIDNLYRSAKTVDTGVDLMLKPGELSKVRHFLSSLRAESSASGSTKTNAIDMSTDTNTTAAGQGENSVNTTVRGKPVGTNAGGIRTGTLSGTPSGTRTKTTWSAVLSGAGVGSGSSKGVQLRGVSFYCPLLAHRRGKYTRGPEALAADCTEQVRKVRSWPRPPDAPTIAKLDEVRSILPELANAAGVMPALPLYDDVIRVYVHLLETCAHRSNSEAKMGAAVRPKRATFGSLQIVAPPQPGLDSVSNARFASATSRKVSDVVSEGHANQCVHVIEQYKVFQEATAPALVPMSVRVIIQQTMAPADSRVAEAYSIVKGSGSEADKKRQEVKKMMVRVFETANTVAFERLKRGTAADRDRRRTLGIELSKQERQASLARESTALAELRVLARCLPVGESAVSVLRASRTLPNLAEDLIMMRPYLSMSQALTLAKSMMKKPTRERSGITVTKPQHHQQQRRYDSQQRIQIQVVHTGKKRSNAGLDDGIEVTAAPSNHKRAKGRKCHYCHSTGHLIADCPAKKQGIPRAKARESNKKNQ